MKIILSSDWHLGKSLYSAKLINEQATFFEDSFFPLLKEIKPDLLIVAGDILDKPLPDQETLFLFEELLRKLATLRIPSIFILGNHDSRRTALHKFFLELAGILILDDLRYFFNPFVFQNERGEKIFLHLLPYLPFYELLEKIKNDGVFIELPEANLGNLLGKLFEILSVKSPSILVSHFATSEGSYSGEEIQIKGLSFDYLISQSLFKKFDYVFLGHLHRPQKAKDKIFYPGAPLPYSFENFSEKRGVYLFEIKEHKILSSQFIPLSPSYELKLIKGFFEEILKSPRTDTYVKVILRDEMPIFNAYERLKEKFPRLLSLEYENRKEIYREINLEVLDIEDMSFEEKELFREFYEFVEGKALDPKLEEIFVKYLEEFYKLEREEGRLCL